MHIKSIKSLLSLCLHPGHLYFDKLQAIISGVAEKKIKGTKGTPGKATKPAEMRLIST